MDAAAPGRVGRSENLCAQNDGGGRVLARLRRMIITGHLAFDERLSGRGLAQRLGASHASVRAAIERLEDEGFVESRPQSGTYLRSPTLREVLELSEVREAIETPMAVRAAARATARDRRELESIRDAMALLARRADRGACGVGAVKEAAELDGRLHQLILGIADNRAAARIVERNQIFTTFWQLAEPYRATSPEGQRFTVAQVHAVHAPIIDAMLAGDADAVRAAMRVHFESANHSYREKLGRSPRGFTLVELLLVITIVAVLVAMMLPSLQRSRDAAVRVQCQANQRQVAASVTAYAIDFKGHFVPGIPPRADYEGAGYGYHAIAFVAGFNAGNTAAPRLWDLRSYFRTPNQPTQTAVSTVNYRTNYISDWRVWACPANAPSAHINSAANWRNPVMYGTLYYFPNTRGRFAGSAQTYVPASDAPGRMHDANANSSAVMTQDATHSWAQSVPNQRLFDFQHGRGMRLIGGAGLNPSWVLLRSTSPNGTLNTDGGPDFDGINIAFYDGHAAWYSQQRTQITGFNNYHNATPSGSVVSIPQN